MLLLSIDYIPGPSRELEALGIVKGSVVQCKSFGKDFMAGMKTFVGGEIEQYTAMLTEARQLATKRMVDEAEALGADAVLNIREMPDGETNIKQVVSRLSNKKKKKEKANSPSG